MFLVFLYFILRSYVFTTVIFFFLQIINCAHDPTKFYERSIRQLNFRKKLLESSAPNATRLKMLPNMYIQNTPCSCCSDKFLSDVASPSLYLPSSRMHARLLYILYNLSMMPKLRSLRMLRKLKK